MNTIVEQVANTLVKRNLRLMTAESCTGGLLAKQCTDRPGSSNWFEGAVVSYSNELKEKLLHVPAVLLKEHGAVSEEVAEQMALGLMHAVKNNKRFVGIAVTGIAGPGGGSTLKPVGTVCFAWIHGSKVLGLETNVFSGDRELVRHKSCEHALVRLMDLLAGEN